MRLLFFTCIHLSHFIFPVFHFYYILQKYQSTMVWKIFKLVFTKDSLRSTGLVNAFGEVRGYIPYACPLPLWLLCPREQRLGKLKCTKQRVDKSGSECGSGVKRACPFRNTTILLSSTIGNSSSYFLVMSSWTEHWGSRRHGERILNQIISSPF